MKKMKLIILMTLISLSVIAPPAPFLAILVNEEIKPFEQIWKATCKVESNFDTLAVGDRHLKDKSYGLVQVRRTRLNDYYDKTGIRYSERDMFDPAKAKAVFMYYCNTLDMETISRQWNGGQKGMQKKSTVRYWNLVKAEL